MRLADLNQTFSDRDFLYFCNARDERLGAVMRVGHLYYCVHNTVEDTDRQIRGTVLEEMFTEYSHYRRLLGLSGIQSVQQVLEKINAQLDLSEIPVGEETTPIDFIARNYEISNQIYEGIHSYHHSHSIPFNLPLKKDKNYKIGVELEIECNNRSSYDEIARFKSNWFTMEHDSSLNSLGIEFVTIPLNPRDAKDSNFWNKLLSVLSCRAISWESPRCGLHIHISRTILGESSNEREKNLTKLLYLYHHIIDESLHNQVFGRSSGYRAESGKTEYGDACKVIGSSILKDISYQTRLDYEMKQKNASNRYFDINITNASTIEFRKGKGSLNDSRITSIIEYCELMCIYCVRTKINKISFSNFIAFLNKNAKDETLRDRVKRFF